MKKAIGFSVGQEADAAPEQRTVPAASRPVPSVAEVHFPMADKSYPYYNDSFDLKEGDVVFVSGKMAGQLGMVTSVTTRFKVDLSYYQKVVSRPELRLSGSFAPVLGLMLSLGKEAAPDAAEFRGWVKPPRDEEEKPQLVYGEGYAFDLEDFESDGDVDEDVMARAIDYCRQGRVRYLSLQDGEGVAFVEGSVWYEVRFRYSEGRVWDMFCDCPYPGLCKHDLAVLGLLRAVLHQLDCSGTPDFVALDQSFFWHVLTVSGQSVAV